MQGVGFLCGLFFCVWGFFLTTVILRLVKLCCVAASRRFSDCFGRQSEVIFDVHAYAAAM